MYLINVQTMRLEFFHDNRGLRYAILSHRWRDGEVLFTDMADGTAHRKAGWAKLQRFCEQAALAEYQYAWCDTCCIDKSSSAELNEALNSMCDWYRGAGECYAYLFDADNAADLGGTAWLTRGWCLQELLVPRTLTFYGQSWQKIGTREQLATRLALLTGIHESALRGAPLDGFSVAQRMAWAADRETTRVEDVAYSLLGLFGVNMPPMYGEGERAFTRLQEEILRRSDDQSIFVHSHSGWLATSPADFRESSRIVPSRKRLVGEPYTLTNMGISIELTLHLWAMESYFALLDCQHLDLDSDADADGDMPHNVVVFVQLAPKAEGRTDRIFRLMVDGKFWAREPPKVDTPSFQSQLLLTLDQTLPRPKHYGFWIRSVESWQDSGKKSSVWAISWNDFVDNMLEIPPGTHSTAGVVICDLDGEFSGRLFGRLILHLGFTPYGVPLIMVTFNNGVTWDDNGRHIELHGSQELLYYLNKEVSGKWPPITYKMILENTYWMHHPVTRPPSVMKSTSRDTPIKQWRAFGLNDGFFGISCRKMEIKGIDTWVVDVRWCEGDPDIPKYEGMDGWRDRRGCASCKTMDAGKRFFVCLEGDKYGGKCLLCRDCFRDVAAHHTIGDSYEPLDYDYYSSV